ncbi:MAG: DUF5666 domain-containing protein [Desulfobacterales bacterium]
MRICHPKCVVLTLLVALLMLVSCWSGGGGGSGPLAGGGIGGSGIISNGVVSAFGSIVVNGTVFDTRDAVVIVEGEEIGVGDDIILDNLDVGRVVTVEGTINDNSFVADRVTYNDNVEGPVESIRDIDTTTQEIVVLGQTVIVNVITKFKATAFDTIALNDLVEVSGLVDDTGAIWATFLEKTGEFMSGVVVEVKGFVDNLDTDLETFEINDLPVDYSLADTSGLPGGIPADGLFVEVEGTLDTTGGTMLATEIELENEVGAVTSDEIEIAGFVTDFVSALEFTVGNQMVQADADTLFIDGTAEDIALGVKLEAEGTLVDGVLFAWEIEFWDPDQIEVEGIVTNFVSVFEFTVGEQVVNTDADTVFDGLAPEDITVGMKLEIKGVPVDIDYSILVADKVSLEMD